MQFPVPQFTDVEDRIIGPLTINSFGIVFWSRGGNFGLFATKSTLVAILICSVWIAELPWLSRK